MATTTTAPAPARFTDASLREVVARTMRAAEAQALEDGTRRPRVALVASITGSTFELRGAAKIKGVWELGGVIRKVPGQPVDAGAYVALTY